MKKILVLLPLLALAAACGPTNREPADNTAADNSTSPPPATAALSEADMIAKEQAIWDTIKNKDWDTFRNVRASEYTEVSPEGVHDLASVLASVKDVEITDITFSDWKTLPIDNDAFLIVYTVSRTGTYKGFPIPSSPFRAATAWANRDGQWLALYHHETPVAPPPPPPGAGQPAPTGAPPQP